MGYMFRESQKKYRQYGRQIKTPAGYAQRKTGRRACARPALE